MAQARHARAVHSFICELLAMVMPDLVNGGKYVRNSTEFCECIDDAIKEATTPDAKEGDYVRAIVEASCREMAALCRLLKAASALAGQQRIAEEYLDANRFREMLLRKDSAKLERLVAIVRAREGRPVKILMDVAAELAGRTESYDRMDSAAKRKATGDMKKLIAKVDEIRGAIDTHKEEIVERVDAVGRKVASLVRHGRRKSKYTDAQRNACRAYWDAAQDNAEVRNSVNTRITYKSVFEHFRRRLEAVGVTTERQFRAILHSAQSRECEDRRRALEAKRDAAHFYRTT